MSTKLSRLLYMTGLPIIIYHFFKRLLWLQTHTAGLYPAFVHQNTQVFLHRAALHAFFPPCLYLCLGCPSPRCGRAWLMSTLHLALLNLSRFPWAHLSVRSRSPCMASVPSLVSVAPLSLVSSVNQFLQRWVISLALPGNWHDVISLQRCIKISTRASNVPQGVFSQLLLLPLPSCSWLRLQHEALHLSEVIQVYSPVPL